VSDASVAVSQRSPTICCEIILQRVCCFMLLTVSKRLEFAASRRLRVDRWSDTENLAAFGPETDARYGSGRNYVAYFVFTGPVDPATGMLINISEIKQRAGRIVRQRFDHKFLNEDNSSFRAVPPTVEILRGNSTSMSRHYSLTTSRHLLPVI